MKVTKVKPPLSKAYLVPQKLKGNGEFLESPLSEDT
jgi:hypothetical protein